MQVNVKLNNKQFEAFELLTDMENGVTEVLYGGGARGGKALLLDETVCTPFGFRRVGDLKVGDIITSATTGGLQKIIQVHPIEKHEYYRVQFNDGTHVDCSEGHLWQIHVSRKQTKKASNERIWETKAMYDWMERRKQGVNADRNLLIPLCAPVQFTSGKKRHRSIPPYVLGALLGDGCLVESLVSKGAVGITTSDQHIVQKFQQHGFNMEHKARKEGNAAMDYRLYDRDLVSRLEELRLAGKKSEGKFVPRMYLYSPIDERKELMRGLMDTDGYVSYSYQF